MPVIVFDSYDATGKTNYARALNSRLGFKIPSHFTYQLPEFKDPKQHAFWSKAQYHMLSRVVSGGVDINMIMDRWIMTEYCYSPVLRGYDIEDYYWDIDKAIAASDNLLWVYPTVEDEFFDMIIQNRFIANNETYVTLEQTRQIKTRFDDLFRRSSIPRVKIDTSSVEPDVINDNLYAIHLALMEMMNTKGDSNLIKLVRGPLGEAGVTGK